MSNMNVWIMVAVASAACLYPLQKMILKNHKSKKLVLSKEILKASSPYQINQPDATYELDNKLSEISGLSATQDSEVIIGVQDEDGILFYLDKTSGNLIREVKFAGDEDYEGIEVVNDQIFVVNSKGDLAYIAGDDDRDEVDSEKIKTFLKRSDDVEGLTYLPGQNALLVACKSNQDGKHDMRNVYLFDINSMQLMDEPFLELDPKDIADVLGRDSKIPYFSPSAIAVHPVSGEIFIVSSPAHAIIVFDKNGSIIDGANLDRVIHAQPEGMFIDDAGKLYIASEARGTVAKIRVFNPKPN